MYPRTYQTVVAKLDLAEPRLSGMMNRKRCTLVLLALTTFIITYSLSLQFGAFRLGTQDSAPDNSQDAPAPQAPFITSNVAVIIDDRPLDNLVPLLLHYSSVLGPTWPILLYTSQTSIPPSAPLTHALHARLITIRTLPPSTHFTSQAHVSAFLTSPWLWEQLAPAGHVLMFQADSIICTRSPSRVSDFLSYDFVGAPIAPAYGEGYNGGLSLRNRSLVLDIVRAHDWAAEVGAGGEGDVQRAPGDARPNLFFEDQWFYKKMSEAGARLPGVEEAGRFAVETLWRDRPLGYHQVERWQADRLGEVDEWCPERRIATSDLLIMHPGT